MVSRYQAPALVLGLLILVWLSAYGLRSHGNGSGFSGIWGHTGEPSADSNGIASSGVKDRPLITYAYSESANARENLQFFLSQGLHAAADFIFILNGETDAASLIPNNTNIRIVHRPNKCFDLGAHGEVLRTDDLWKSYRRFITLNASIRGPFIPYWAHRCWSDIFLDRITDKVKLVGMTANCLPHYHIQSMIWATDELGMKALLNPPVGSSVMDKYGTPSDPVGLSGCYPDMKKAVHGEIGATRAVRRAGYRVDALMTAFHGFDYAGEEYDYEAECIVHPVEDVLWDRQYYGANVHPYESIFAKANRDIDPVLMQQLTSWHLQGSMPKAMDLCR